MFIPVCVFRFSFCFLSLVWFFLWLPEEVLALLFLLHCENGDFSVLMKDISICDMETLELRFKELWTLGRSSSNL